MQRSESRLAWILYLLVGGCGGHGGSAGPGMPDAAPIEDAAGAPDTGPSAVTIVIQTDESPTLLAVRDGLSGAWSAPTMTSPGVFTAQVQGPYVVARVCIFATATPQGIPHSVFVARTPDDDRTVKIFCDPVFGSQEITGHMVQAGSVAVGTIRETSSTPDWAFDLPAVDGPNDLIATTAGAFAIRRGITLSGGESLALTTPVDIAVEGSSLIALPLVVEGATAGESLAATVTVRTALTAFNAPIFKGAVAAAMGAPAAALLPTDVQRVTVEADGRVSLRRLRRPFRIGDDNVFTLPPALPPVSWTIDGGRLSLAWSALPPVDTLTIDARGSCTGGVRCEYELLASGRFLAAAAATQLVVDTDIPGFQAGWQIALDQGYSRSVLVEHTDHDELATAGISNEFAPPSIGAGAAAASSTLLAR